jgi:hypothetical protein
MAALPLPCYVSSPSPDFDQFDLSNNTVHSDQVTCPSLSEAARVPNHWLSDTWNAFPYPGCTSQAGKSMQNVAFCRLLRSLLA